MAVIVTLKPYLDKLTEAESLKDNPRPVPSLADLARAAGIQRSGLSKIADNHVDGLSREKLARIIGHLRKAGFYDTDVCHLLRYVD